MYGLKNILFELAVVIFLSKIVSHFCEKIKQPPVFGLLLTGLILGESGFKLLRSNEVIEVFSEIGAILLLFMAGLETDIAQVRKEARISFTTAIWGVVLPFFFGFCIARSFGFEVNKSLFLGTILTATSVAITVMTLYDLKKLETIEGRTILSAAVIDDALSVILLAFVLSLIGKETRIFISFAKMIIFFVVASFLGFFLVRRSYKFSKRLRASRATIAIALSTVLFFAWFAKSMGIAEITGAYLAGLFSSREMRREVMRELEAMAHGLFVPVFFTNIGLKAQIHKISGNVLFLICFILIAIMSKIIGCGLGAKIAKLPAKTSLRIGVGMVPRGEVALIIASIGLSKNLIGHFEFSLTVILSLVTAIFTPLLLRLLFK